MVRSFALALFLAVPAVAAEPAPDPAAVAVVFDRGSIRPVIVEGLADRESGRPVEANDPVRIASISKLVMALAALRLVDEGKIDLDADVSTYLGWRLRHPDYPDVPVTLAQLLSHRSGLRDDAGYVIPLGKSLQARLADRAVWYPGTAPGAAPFKYANLGSPVVATVLEAATGERYDRLVERTVFAPLGIKACLNWIGCAPEQVDRAVVLYRSTGEVARDDAANRPPNCTIPVAEDMACEIDSYVPGTNASIFSPQGGVRIGMLDLAKIGQVLFDLQWGDESGFLTPATAQRAMWSIASNDTGPEPWFCHYGLHMQAIEAPGRPCDDALFGDGNPRFGHAGEAYGLRSGLWIDPKGKKGLAYFVTGVPEPVVEDSGGFAAEEVELVGRAMNMVK